MTYVNVFKTDTHNAILEADTVTPHTVPASRHKIDRPFKTHFYSPENEINTTSAVCYVITTRYNML